MTEKCKGNDRKVYGKWQKSVLEMRENCKGNDRKVNGKLEKIVRRTERKV